MARLVADRLDRMAMALGEIPEIARLEIIDLGLARGIKNDRLATAADHESPFLRDRMPVQFARSARVQEHVNAGQTLHDRQLVFRRFLRPSARSHLWL